MAVTLRQSDPYGAPDRAALSILDPEVLKSEIPPILQAVVMLLVPLLNSDPRARTLSSQSIDMISCLIICYCFLLVRGQGYDTRVSKAQGLDLSVDYINHVINSGNGAVSLPRAALTPDRDC